MCLNCCGHMILILKFITSQSIVSDIIGLSDDSGFNKIKGFVNTEDINDCKRGC
jgi:hypothetical protein